MGPYISSCGMSISITGGHCYRQSIECDGPDAVRRAVRIQCNKGADVIKFMGSGGLEHFPQEDPSIPQFTLAPDAKPVFHSGIIGTVEGVPLVWDRA